MGKVKTARLRECPCGSRRFLADITLEIKKVPVWFSKAGTLSYDDTKGESCGWDTAEQPEVYCAKCGHLFHIERTGDATDTAYLLDKEVQR